MNDEARWAVFHNESGNDQNTMDVFICYAEDGAHAVEQMQDAYSNQKICFVAREIEP